MGADAELGSARSSIVRQATTDMIRLNEKRDRSFSKESSLAGWFDMGAALAWAAIMAAKAWRPSRDVKSKILNYRRLIRKIT
jgi:hypothetical protein